ncbi:MAG: heme-binding protein [Bdellovibrionales bacterium]|nr:heme-binding protein [Bdellovibrionales bacterium]
MKRALVGASLLIQILQAGCSLFGIRSEEIPKYQVVLKDDNKEIRLYSPYIVARTTVDGNFDEAQSKGFRILADYIFGNNKSKETIPMTAPVVQKQKGESIAMTAPVVMNPSQNRQQWTMAFSMPSRYNLQSLPIPNDKRIELVERGSHYTAAIIYSGRWSEEKNRKMGQELEEWLVGKNDYDILSQPQFAGYNPPWTLPFFRHNEMLIDVRKK